jgi:hypothetical protein
MAAISKMSRDASTSQGASLGEEADLFDFGEPELISVEIAPGSLLILKEPSASDLIEISKISDNKNISDVESTLQTICILHSPNPGGRKLTLKDAKKLTARQLRKLGEAINMLLGLDGEGE